MARMGVYTADRYGRYVNDSVSFTVDHFYSCLVVKPPQPMLPFYLFTKWNHRMAWPPGSGTTAKLGRGGKRHTRKRRLTVSVIRATHCDKTVVWRSRRRRRTANANIMISAKWLERYWISRRHQHSPETTSIPPMTDSIDKFRLRLSNFGWMLNWHLAFRFSIACRCELAIPFFSSFAHWAYCSVLHYQEIRFAKHCVTTKYPLNEYRRKNFFVFSIEKGSSFVC